MPEVGVDDLPAIVVRDGAEFFPMSSEDYRGNVAYQRQLRKDRARGISSGYPARSLGRVPHWVYHLTCHAHDGNTHVWDSENGERHQWWQDVLSGSRWIKFVATGPGGGSGLWIGGKS